jgi:diaminohydroxyphosphoribosylaminopyrimidine deaminase/5-amino-6-(5-phosphoribosylamino)uracil reductase
MFDRDADKQFMRRAFDLARLGIGVASPNPCVGAVIVDGQGNIAGAATHTYAGIKHAEILALEQAREVARGATLYINLEPCSHQGRTPPCADALIAAGIRRVVASIDDPNPAVAGRGFEKLRAAGVQVEVGALAGEARRLNESFARYIRHGMPFVTLKSAMTLDGKIAPCATHRAQGIFPVQTVGRPNGGWITGEASRAHVQQLRHQSDALLAGVGTVLSDDPLLTDRSGLPRRRPLLRVILDSRLRTPADSRLVRSARDGDLLVFCVGASKEQELALRDHGARVEVVPANHIGQVDLPEVLRRLGQLQITSLMIEGGSHVNGAALAARIVDKVFLYYAPTIFADGGAIPFAVWPNSADQGEPIRVKSPRIHRFEEDFAVEGYIRGPYET